MKGLVSAQDNYPKYGKLESEASIRKAMSSPLPQIDHSAF